MSLNAFAVNSHPSQRFSSATSLEHSLSSQPNVMSLISGHSSTYGTKRVLSIFHLTLQLSVCASPFIPTDYKDILHAIKPLTLFFAMLCGKWDLSSPTKDYTHAPALEAWSLNHWTARRVPPTLFMGPHFGQISRD